MKKIRYGAADEKQRQGKDNEYIIDKCFNNKNTQILPYLGDVTRNKVWAVCLQQQTIEWDVPGSVNGIVGSSECDHGSQADVQVRKSLEPNVSRLRVSTETMQMNRP